MSTTETRLPLVAAANRALVLVEQLRCACVRIEIAGSIRRQKADIGDIELVAIPRYAHEVDLFGDPCGTANVLEARVAWLLECGALAPRLTTDGQPRLGLKYKALVFEEMPVDLFITTPECWGVIFTIRTGPAGFSHRLVTRREHGGWLPNHLRVREGRLVGTDGQPLDTSEEADVFAAIGLEWIAPEQRT